MGDQVTAAVTGDLVRVSAATLERLRREPAASQDAVALFASACRINTLYMIARAGSGHVGTCFSCMDILALLHRRRMGPDDIFFSSKGHDAPALYSTLIGLGRLDYDRLDRLRRVDGLPGHPDVETPGIVTNTGSLGMGISKAKGMIKADRLLGRHREFFVLTGDGELQEGQFWESLASAVRDELSELTVIVDHNKVQSDTLVSRVSDLGDLEAKLRAFGWEVRRCNGHDLAALDQALQRDPTDRRPLIVIADTIKGRGVPFMEHDQLPLDTENYPFHSGAPTLDQYAGALEALTATAEAQAQALGFEGLAWDTVSLSPAGTGAAATAEPPPPERLVDAYGQALLIQAAAHPELVALDADLVLDTGLIPFQQRYPDRFVECGIAEQDMVSQAGGMALQGLLPVVHSFACFLSTRPNEQIYNNATEGTRILYVGTMGGVLPGAPGHSHQSVRDVSALGAMPGMTLLQPGCAAEVAPLLDWAVNDCPGSAYLRLLSLPWPAAFERPVDTTLVPGQGYDVRPTSTPAAEVAFIAHGPVLLSQAMAAADRLEASAGISARVINLPWLNQVDADWLAELAATVGLLVALDDHYRIGGQGDRIAHALAREVRAATGFLHLGLQRVPVCGTSDEVLAAHGLDAECIAAATEHALSPGAGS